MRIIRFYVYYFFAYIRSLVRGSVFYLVQMKVRERRIDLIPGKNTDLHLAAYPRSGSTFISGLIKEFFPGIVFCSHVHSIITMKYARKHGVKTIVIARNPEDAISSYVVKRLFMKKDSLDFFLAMALRDYIWYYSFVLRYFQDSPIFDFDTAIHEPERFLCDICQILGANIQLLSRKEWKGRIEAVVRRIQKDERQTSKWQSLNSFLPNQEKEQMKKELKEILKPNPKFKIAREIYSSLCQKKFGR